MILTAAQRTAALEVMAGRWPDRLLVSGGGALGGDDFWGAVRFLRLQGMAIAAAPDGAPIPEAVRAAATRDAFARELTLEAAERSVGALHDAGVPVLVFKGAALVAAGVYGEGEGRRMDDADLLVPAECAGDAVRALVSEGFVPWGSWIPGSEGWLDTATLRLPEAPDAFPVSIDLHWRLGRGELRFGAGGREAALGIPPEVPRTGGASSLPLPDPDGHYVHLVEHLLRHLRVLVHPPGIADLLRAADRIRDPERVASLLAEGPLAPAAFDLVRAVADRASTASGRETLGRVAAAGTGVTAGIHRLEELLDGDLSDRRGRWAGAAMRFRMAGGGLAGLRDLGEGVLPTSGWLAARYPHRGATGARLAWGADLLRWIAGGDSPASPNQPGHLDARPGPGADAAGRGHGRPGETPQPAAPPDGPTPSVDSPGSHR